MTAQEVPPSGKAQAMKALPSALHALVLALPFASHMTGASSRHCENTSSWDLQVGGIPQWVAQSPCTVAEHMRASSFAQAMRQSEPPDVPPPAPPSVDPFGVVEIVHAPNARANEVNQPIRVPSAIFLTEPPRTPLYRIE